MWEAFSFRIILFSDESGESLSRFFLTASQSVYTSDMKKYLLRLLAFDSGDIAGNLFNLNIFFTLKEKDAVFTSVLFIY